MAERKVRFQLQVVDRNGSPLRFKNGYVPDLIFYVPPSNYEVSAKKIPTREPTKGGWVEYHGGDDLDIITVNGSTGIMFSMGTGLVNLSEGALGTDGYLFLNNLLTVFRNNGNSYDSRGLIYDTGYVKLIYDKFIYKGFLENLSYNDVADKPYHREYNFSYVVEDTLVSLIRPIGGNSSIFRGTP